MEGSEACVSGVIGGDVCCNLALDIGNTVRCINDELGLTVLQTNDANLMDMLLRDFEYEILILVYEEIYS